MPSRVELRSMSYTSQCCADSGPDAACRDDRSRDGRELRSESARRLAPSSKPTMNIAIVDATDQAQKRHLRRTEAGSSVLGDSARTTGTQRNNAYMPAPSRKPTGTATPTHAHAHQCHLDQTGAVAAQPRPTTHAAQDRTTDNEHPDRPEPSPASASIISLTAIRRTSVMPDAGRAAHRPVMHLVGASRRLRTKRREHHQQQQRSTASSSQEQPDPQLRCSRSPRRRGPPRRRRSPATPTSGRCSRRRADVGTRRG